MTRNPKQDGSVLYDCIPQTGPCPNACHECFYNRPGAFYTDIAQPTIPDPRELPEGAIVRMNSGHDSNLHRPVVLSVARMYPRTFFNTAIPRLDFPGPVVLTVNPKEEESYTPPPVVIPTNLMFVRVRVSPGNADLVPGAVHDWTEAQVPVVLTFMRYYDSPVPTNRWPGVEMPPYEFKKHILNSYWCPTTEFMRRILEWFKRNRLVTMCGTPIGGLCKDCRNCETYYLQTMKRMRGE